MSTSRKIFSIRTLSWLAAFAFSTAVHASPERVDQLVKTALDIDPNSKHGAALYAAQCKSCHGPLAYGDAAKLIPALAGQRRSYIIKELADFTELERAATQMHVVVARSEVSEPQDWADVAAYLNGLKPLASPQTGNGKYLSLGEASYQQWCTSCHEEDGRGDDDGFIPSLRNQHYAYLLQEMRGLAAMHRTNVDPDLSLFMDGLANDEMEGIADYISRMHGPVKDRAKLREDGTVGD
ncbi:MAG TPA: c-type cytochrome [Steroidobacteraceae bacterium]|nr:c-type cytochrome [Steroidobacteraceae bacterium]